MVDDVEAMRAALDWESQARTAWAAMIAAASARDWYPRHPGWTKAGHKWLDAGAPLSAPDTADLSGEDGVAGEIPTARPLAPDEMREALENIRRNAFLLLQNSEGCAANHYGDCFEMYGMPQWLLDCRQQLERDFAALNTHAMSGGSR